MATMTDAKPQVSIRTALVYTSIVCVLFGIARPWPHVAVFLGCIFSALATTRLLHRFRRRRWVIALPCAASWLILYAASVGPYYALLTYVVPRNDAWGFVIWFVGPAYSPLDFVSSETFLEDYLLRYLEQWDCKP